MVSALESLVASAVVVLFGGFLLAGILTPPDGDELAPAAVTASPAPRPDEPVFWPEDPEGPDFLPGPTTTDGLLAVAVTEQVAPGVLRVVSDGMVDLAYRIEGASTPSIVAGHDGGIWVLDGGGYHRLGEGLAHIDRTEGEVDGVTHYVRDWPPRSDEDPPSDFEIASDGSVRAVFTDWGIDDEEVMHLHSIAPGSDDWTRSTGRVRIEVTPDGTVWAVWRDDAEGAVFGYLGVDGWQPLGEWPYPDGHGAMYVSDRSDVWAVGVDTRAHHFVDGAWRMDDDGKLYRRGMLNKDGIADVGPDGTLWGLLRDGFARFDDDTGWTIFEPPDLIPSEVDVWRLVDDEWVATSALEGGVDVTRTYESTSLESSSWGVPHVAPDGSLWVSVRLGEWRDDAGRSVCDHGIDGVVRFDGMEWAHLLQGYCVQSLDVAPDGSVWLLATESDARFPLIQTYVITSEALTATE